jgi:rRNA-processing protein FCF1
MASNRLWRNPKEKTVILDSSSIMMPFEYSINLEDELTRLLGKTNILIPKPIVDELIFLSKNGKGRKKLLAKPALELIKNYKIVDSEGKGDDSVLFLAKKINAIVVTNDRELRNRLKKESLQTIFLRGKKRLVLE